MQTNERKVDVKSGPSSTPTAGTLLTGPLLPHASPGTCDNTVGGTAAPRRSRGPESPGQSSCPATPRRHQRGPCTEHRRLAPPRALLRPRAQRGPASRAPTPTSQDCEAHPGHAHGTASDRPRDTSTPCGAQRSRHSCLSPAHRGSAPDSAPLSTCGKEGNKPPQDAPREDLQDRDNSPQAPANARFLHPHGRRTAGSRVLDAQREASAWPGSLLAPR